MTEPDPVAGSLASLPPATEGGLGHPERIDRYLVRGELGRGGMGVVFEAEDPALKRTVALKVLPTGAGATDSQVKRFIQEARAASGLRHPSIVTVHDVGESEGRFYLAMDRVQGPSLGRVLLRGEPLEPRRALEIALDVASALEHAHGHGIVHRDVKPDNILLDERGRALLTDFGLAKDLRSDARVTRSGEFVGSPAYASPEHLVGRALDGRTDVYSLGATLYESLTMHRPFETLEGDLPALFNRGPDVLPPPLRRYRSELPAPVEAIVFKCLEWDPGRRYASAAELARDIERFLRGERVHARSQGLRRFVVGLRRRRFALALALGLVASVLVPWIARARARALARLEAQEARALAELVGDITVEERIGRLEKQLASDPGFWEGHCELARLERRLSRERRRDSDRDGARAAALAAHAEIERAVETGSRRQLGALLLFDAELCRLDVEDPALWHESLERLAAVDPGSASAAYARARLALALGRHDEAASEVERALAQAPLLVPARLLEAQLALDASKPRDALAALGKLQGGAWRRDDPEQAALAARAFEQLGERGEALHQLDHAIELDPLDTSTRLARGRLRVEVGRSDALADLDAVLATEPRAVEPRALRALARANAGYDGGAAQDLDALAKAGVDVPERLRMKILSGIGSVAEIRSAIGH